MAKIIVYLGEQEREALQQLAQREMRVPRARAGHAARTGKNSGADGLEGRSAEVQP